jgi:hypothetical protein
MVTANCTSPRRIISSSSAGERAWATRSKKAELSSALTSERAKTESSWASTAVGR